MKKNNSYPLLQKIAIALAAATALIIGGLSVAAVREQQDIRQQAQSIDTVQFLLIPASTQIKPGQDVVVDIEINTQSKSVSGFTVQGSIQGVASNRVAISPTQIPNLISHVDWISDTANGATFSITYLSNPQTSSIFTTQGKNAKIASLIMSPTKSSEVTVTIESSPKTAVFEHKKGLVRTAIGYVQSFTVGVTETSPTPAAKVDTKKSCDENCATDTECRSEFVCYKGRCRVPSDREDPRCTVPEDPGLNRSCNEYCADSRECNSKYTCYYNRCRLAENIDSTSCTLPARPAVSQATTQAGVGGSGQTNQVKQNTVQPTPSLQSKPASTPKVSPSPKAISATITVVPTASVSIQLATRSAQAATSTGTLSTQPTVQELTDDAAPIPPSPQIVPLPDDLTPEALAAEQNNSNFGRTILIALSSIGIIGLIGFGVYYWRNN